MDLESDAEDIWFNLIKRINTFSKPVDVENIPEELRYYANYKYILEELASLNKGYLPPKNFSRFNKSSDGYFVSDEEQNLDIFESTILFKEILKQKNKIKFTRLVKEIEDDSSDITSLDVFYTTYGLTMMGYIGKASFIDNDIRYPKVGPFPIEPFDLLEKSFLERSKFNIDSLTQDPHEINDDYDDDIYDDFDQDYDDYSEDFEYNCIPMHSFHLDYFYQEFRYALTKDSVVILKRNNFEAAELNIFNHKNSTNKRKISSLELKLNVPFEVLDGLNTILKIDISQRNKINYFTNYLKSMYVQNEEPRFKKHSIESLIKRTLY